MLSLPVQIICLLATTVLRLLPTTVPPTSKKYLDICMTISDMACVPVGSKAKRTVSAVLPPICLSIK